MKPVLLFILSFFIAGNEAFAGRGDTWPYPWDAGDVHINFSIPWINGYYFRMPATDMGKAGCLGISMGADYVYRPEKFVSMQAGSAIDFPVPFPAPFDRFPDSNGYLCVENMSTSFVNLRHNHAWHRFDFGYGLVLSRHTWLQKDSYLDSLTGDNRIFRNRYVNIGLGGSFAAYYRLGRLFYTGILYQPQLLSIQNGVRLKYEHFISFDLLFRFDFGTRPRATHSHTSERPPRSW